MKPNALPPLADRYCTAINTLLRRELHTYTSELKKSAVARMAIAPPEPDIVRGVKRVLLSAFYAESVKWSWCAVLLGLLSDLIRDVVSMSIRRVLVSVCCHTPEGSVRVGYR